MCCLDVMYERNRGGSFIGLCGPCCRFKGSSYLLGAVTIFWKMLVRNSNSWLRESWSQRALAVWIREARTICLQGGDVNPGVGKDWYGWASNRLCDPESHPVSCRCQYPKMEGGLFYFSIVNWIFIWNPFWCFISIQVLQNFCQLFSVMKPDDEGVVYISEPAYRFLTTVFK
jgi:hypothetical protein